MSKVTICIPICEQRGHGYAHLKRLLDSIKEQVFTDYDVIVSDNSTYFAKAKMRDICSKYKFVTYIENPKIGMSENTNFAMKHATGEYIKIMYQDDYFANAYSLAAIMEVLEENDHKFYWAMVGAEDNTKPYWTDDIETGNNKLGSPSALIMKNKNIIYFDEPMRWLLDCDYYKRLYKKHGEPLIIDGIFVKLGKGEHQFTNILTDEEKQSEVDYLKAKYEKN